jgi:hypothetical protein
MIMTYDEIYEKLAESTGERFTLLECLKIWEKEGDWCGAGIQQMKIKELMTAITGIRPGNCSGCFIDALNNMVRWLNRYEKEHPKVEEVKPKLGRPIRK